MSASLCGGSQTASACRCSANSPFRWAESYKPGSSFAADWQKNATSAKASTDLVERKRADGIDPGHISGLNTPAHQLRPSQTVVDKAARKALAKKRAADILKPAKSGITITKRGDFERSKKLRMASI